jgi:hypothetical protein
LLLMLAHFNTLSCRLTKKAEPPPTRDVDCNRSGNGGWLRRLVRQQRRESHGITFSILKTPTAMAK